MSNQNLIFRDGRYHKKVTVGKRRVKDGECCAIWDRSGSVRTVMGPKLEWICWSDVRFLDRFIADQNSYLVVSFRDGRKDHVRGPASLFLDPVVHKAIAVEAAVSLNAFEAIVVYRELDDTRDGIEAPVAPGSEESKADDEAEGGSTGGSGPNLAKAKAKATAAASGGAAASAGGERPAAAVVATARPIHVVHGGSGGKRVTRRVIRGPTLFIPAANEWVHKFSWHGSNDRMDDQRTMIKDALKLTKIRTLPDQLYYNVVGCRTQDDAQLTVRLMVFFSLLDLETMLDSTHDPIGDFVNAVSADVIRFAAESTFEGFVHRSAELNELAAFKVLRERAARIGYSVDKVVFRGYKASEQLQAMHDQAIKARTKLQLEARTAEQTEQLQDMLLDKRAARAVQERAMEKASREHGLALARLEHAEQLTQAQAAADAAHAQAVAADAQRAAFLKELGNAGVNLTSYLVAHERRQGSGGGEQVLRVEGLEAAAGGAALAPHLHLGGR